MPHNADDINFDMGRWGFECVRGAESNLIELSLTVLADLLENSRVQENPGISE